MPSRSPSGPSRAAWAAKVLTLAAAYFVCGKLSLLLAIPPGYATAVWPPAGIALAALLVYGPGIWPGVLLGSFLVNAGTSFDPHSASTAARSLALAGGIGAGASLQAILGTLLIRRYVGLPLELVRERDIVKFLLLGGLVSCAANATISVTMLLGAGLIDAGHYPVSWWTWWVGDTIGVAVVAPFVLVWIAEPRAVWRRRRITVAGPLVVMFALVVAFFVRASAWEETRARSEFEARAKRISAAVETQLASSIEVLYAVAGLFHSSDEVRRDQFRVFVAPFLARHPTIQAISWNPRVAGANRRSFEEVARREVPAFRFTEMEAATGLVPAGGRAEYVVVGYIEPASANVAALGFDVASEALRAEALRRAASSGEPAVTGPIRLVQETGPRAGLLVFLPVYAAPDARPGGAAPGLPVGYITGAFRPVDMIAAGLRGVPRHGIATVVRDVDAPRPGAVLFSDAGAGPSAPAEGLGLQSTFEVAGRTWSVDSRATALYAGGSTTWQALAVLATGLLFTAMLGALCLSMTGQAIVVDRLGQERVAELSKANEALLREVAEREMAQATLREVVESTSDAVVLADDRGRVIGWNRGAQDTFGYTTDEIRGRSLQTLMPERYHEGHQRGLERYLATGERRVIGQAVSLHGRRRDGSEFPLELSLGSWQVSGRHYFGAILRDTTARTEMETALRHAQKMEAVGQLAGGVAHDFNNLLTVISGYAHVLLAQRALPADARRSVDMIVTASQRAANLTRELLAFSRKQLLQPVILDPNEVLAGTERMVRPAIGANIELCIEPNPAVGRIFADRGQIEQVVLNLVLNARDAMPDGGKLSIRIYNPTAGAPQGAMHQDLAAGHYVVIRVADTGSGMDAKTRARIFEPFFTTKEPGEGTGLGLATVYGIVRQSGGHIDVESEPGRGSAFRIFMPRADDEPATLGDAPAGDVTGGRETILLVEDDEAVRALAAEVLDGGGYTVLAAANAEAALLIAASQPIDLVLTDTVMPGMNGRKLVEELRARGADVAALLMSGYSSDAIGRHGVLAADVAFLAKPFDPSALLAKVREVLDEGRAGPG